MPALIPRAFACARAAGGALFDERSEGLQEGCSASNEQLLKGLRLDKYEDALRELAIADSKLHRMTRPVKASKIDTSKASCLASHFLLRVHCACCR